MVIRNLQKIQTAPFSFRYVDLEFLITHTQFSLDKYVRSGKYDVVVYGHTHRPDIHRQGNTLIVNPGETGGWVTGKATVALLDPESLEANILQL